MRKASFPDSYKPIVRVCFRCVTVAAASAAAVAVVVFFSFSLFSKPNIFYYDYCYDFIICLLFKFNVEPLMISSENKLHTHISRTVIMNKKKKERKKEREKTEGERKSVRRTEFFFDGAAKKILFIE